jgi:1-aminocyclopropane-1-carboxylate deaminase/D-cysteine desulfhydrase-like pyridoxal-dependent ACC family enzyme
MIDSGLDEPGVKTSSVPGPSGRADAIPLVRRFPALAAIPRARLGRFPTPVEHLEGFQDVERLYVKREDLSSDLLGGNKVRSLEFLLGRIVEGDTVLTLGGEGSTHVLATAVHAARLGARTIAVRWRHDMHSAAHEVAARALAECEEIVTAPSFLRAMPTLLRLRLTRPALYIPLGGSTALGTLGHVNAALELADQIEAGALPRPARVVVPLGSGGTAAGLALGFAMSGLDAVVIGARVGPRIGANRFRVMQLVEQTRRLIRRYTGRTPPSVRRDRVAVSHDLYGGAYARPHPTAEHASVLVDALRGWRLDATYSAKAFAAALDIAAAEDTPTLFWLTFDARWMTTFTEGANNDDRSL